MWVPPEDADPVIFHEPTRKALGVYGAVCVSDGRLVTSRAETFNKQSLLSFLEQLLPHRNKDRKMVVIMDNAPWHHAKEVQEWLKKHKKHLRLDFLPPYSPQLNPMERVWKLTRKLRTHNRYFPCLDELVDTVFDQFNEWLEPNLTLRQLCAII